MANSQIIYVKLIATRLLSHALENSLLREAHSSKLGAARLHRAHWRCLGVNRHRTAHPGGDNLILAKKSRDLSPNEQQLELVKV